MTACPMTNIFQLSIVTNSPPSFIIHPETEHVSMLGTTSVMTGGSQQRATEMPWLHFWGVPLWVWLTVQQRIKEWLKGRRKMVQIQHQTPSISLQVLEERWTDTAASGDSVHNQGTETVSSGNCTEYSDLTVSWHESFITQLLLFANIFSFTIFIFDATVPWKWQFTITGLCRKYK